MNENKENEEQMPQEQDFYMTLNDGSNIDAGCFWMSRPQGHPERRLVSVDYNGYFRNLPTNAVLNGLVMDLHCLGWRGPVTVLPQPAHSYHGHVNVSEEDEANGFMLGWIQRMVDGLCGEVYKLRVFVASHHGIGDIAKEINLRDVIHSLDDGENLTFWIFFHLDGGDITNDYEGAQINPDLKPSSSDESSHYSELSGTTE